MGEGCGRGGDTRYEGDSAVGVGCAGTGMGETDLDEQYLRSKSAASFGSPTVLLFRASTTFLHVGEGG